MTLYGVVSFVVIVAFLVCLAGTFFPLKLFGQRRLVAFGVAILVAVVSPTANVLKSPEEVRKEKAAKPVDSEMANLEDAENVRANLDIDAKYSVEDYKISGSIRNSSKHSYANVKVHCLFFSENHSKIASTKFVVYKNVLPNRSVHFSNIDSGVVDPQVAGISCEITDADGRGI